MHAHHGHKVPHLGSTRARRGEIPTAVLALLKVDGMHGYKMIQEISDRTSGAWIPSPGSIYPVLQGLEDKGLVESTPIDGKRIFSLTEVGRTHAEMIPEGSPWEDFSAESDPERRLRESFAGLMQAARQIAKVGSAEQVSTAADILGESRRQIYAMLSDDK